MSKRQIEFTQHCKQRTPELIAATMYKLSKEGYGFVFGKQFYKNPNLSSKMLSKYNIVKENYLIALGSHPASGASTSFRTRQEQQDRYRELFGNPVHVPPTLEPVLVEHYHETHMNS